MTDAVSSVSKTEEKKKTENESTSSGAAPPTSNAAANRAAASNSTPESSSSSSTRSSSEGGRTTTTTPDRVDVSKGEDDKRENTVRYTADPRMLRNLPPDERAQVMADSREGREVLDDGTVKEYHAGRTTTTKADGTRTQEYRKDGNSITETSYKKNGADVHEVEKRGRDGSVHTESTVEKDGRLEKTVSDTTLSDKRIEELQPGLKESGALKSDLGKEGSRNKTEVTHVTTTVTDTTKSPPESRTSLERTTYSQHIALGDKDPEATGMSKDTLGVKNYAGRGHTYQADALDGVDVNRSESGVTLAYSTTKTTDEKGKVKNSTESGETRTIVGTKDGREVQLTEASARVEADGKTREVKSREMRGILEKNGDRQRDVQRVGKLNEKDDYERRIAEGPVNFRETEVYNVEGNGDKHLDSRTQEYGDYDKPASAGRTVTITEDDGRTSWNYRRIDDTDKGIRVRSQTGVEGSEGHIVSDGTQNRDGTFASTTKFVDNEGVALRIEKRERSLVQPGDFTKEKGYHGDPAYAQEFAQDNAGRTIYKDKVAITDAKDDFKHSYNLQQYTAEGSDSKLTSVFQHGDPRNTTVLEEGDSDTPARMKIEGGPEFSIDRKGQSYVEVDGRKVAIPKDKDLKEAPTPHGGAESSSGAFKNLYATVKNLDKVKNASGATGDGADAAPELTEFLKTHPKVSAGLGGLSVLAGGATIYSGVREGDAGDVLSGSSALAGGLGDLSALGSKVVSSSKLTSVLGAGGKALGAAGAVLGAGYGVYQISQGEMVEAGFTLAAAAGTGLAVGAGIAGVTGWVPVAGWAVAGVAIVGGVVYDLWKADREAHKTHELEF